MDYGYCRVSSQEQSTSGQSIDAQINKMLKLNIERKNIYIDDGKSGGVKEDMVEYVHQNNYFITRVDVSHRKALLELMSKVKEGDTIYIAKWDRLSRNISFAESFIAWFERLGVNIKPIDESPDRLSRKILLVVAEEELLKTTDRNLTIVQSIYEKGGWAFRSPYGYILNSKDKNGNIIFPKLKQSCLVIDKPKAEIVQQVFSDIANGKYYRDVATKHKLDRTTIYTMIRNRVYLGETHTTDTDWKKTDQIPQIVSQELFNQANEKLKIKEKIKY